MVDALGFFSIKKLHFLYEFNTPKKRPRGEAI